MSDRGYEGWTILELMGHRRLAGMVREAEVAGGKFLRLDVPGEGEAVVATQFYSPSAVYCVTPTTEEVARAIARGSRPAPVHRWELPAPASAPAQASEGGGGQDDRDDDRDNQEDDQDFDDPFGDSGPGDPPC